MTNIPAWQPHIEVWLLVAGVIGLGLYTSRVIQPAAVQAGGEPITVNQRRWFILGVFLLWLASDWPIHDIAEERLYSMHMVQHMLLTVVVPPVMLMAMPKWLGHLVMGEGAVWRVFVRLARPLPAAIIFNVVGALAHWGFVVNLAVRNGPFHYMVHTVIVTTAFLAWVPVCGPFRELQMSDPGKMIYIFLLSIIPTVPAAFLTTADGVLYSGYDHGPRLWGLSVINDQQLAGVVMKVIEGFYLWVIILVMFLRWIRPVGSDHYRGKLVGTHH
ncbi:MAG: cytochrome c oxidase assembly protein [Microthrixaceae bacterium]|nr:cytochrome c oxidase assembly protein [Microthrixaceae bacterium]